MPTYSTNLAFNLPNDGEYSGTWGQIMDLNMGTLIEQAISGYVTQAITDGADTVITIPLGATGVARNMYIEATGALSATRNLVVPANKKLYFFYNNTTGSQSVVVKVSGQTGVTVPAGQKVALVCNGTDIVAATGFFNAVDINGGTIDGTPVGATTPSTGSFTTVDVTGASLPANGMYLIGANNPGITSASTLRWNVSNTGGHTFAAPSGAIPTVNLIANNANVSVLNLSNTDLTQPVFVRWGRNATTFDAYLGVAGAASDILTGSAQGDYVLRNDSGNILFGISTGIKGKVTTAGQWQLWEGVNNVAAAALMVAATYETGTFTATMTGCTTTPTVSVAFRRVGPVVTLDVPQTIATSNTTAYTLTGLTAALTPTRTQRCSTMVQDSTTNEGGYCQIAGASTILTFLRSNGTATFTNSGQKGNGLFSFTYNIS